jgi:hypothetical protein
MTRRSVGLLLLIFGGLVAAIGLIGMFTSDDGTGSEALPTSTTASQDIRTTTTTSVATTSTTQIADTTTTSVPATTTTTLDATAAIETFVEEFSVAIERQDVDSLMAALHPAVLEAFNEELCRSFIEDEILLLGDYRLTGPIQGPTPQNIGSFTVGMYTGPVAFTFQGQDFESDASFAIEANGVTWFTECRGS